MSSKCPRCKKTVYDAECVQGAGRKWHSECFRCLECGSGLSSTTIAEKDGEVYCANDYAKLFGPKGFGIGGLNTVTGISVSDDGKSSSSSKGSTCSSCGARNQSGKFCGECGSTVSASSFSQPANTVGNRPPSPRASGRIPTVKATSSSSSVLGGPKVNERCGVCGETAFFAESVNAAGRTFHSECFKCFNCRVGLNSQTLAEKESKIYCNACYGKLFGPKGYGFAGGAATTFAVTK